MAIDPSAPITWNEAARMLLDKGLLTIAAGLVSWFTARQLERFKRDQAMSLELGKLRAQEFVRLYSTMMRALRAIVEFSQERAKPTAQRHMTGEALMAILVETRAVFRSSIPLGDSVDEAFRRFDDAVNLVGGQMIEGKSPTRGFVELESAMQGIEHYIPKLKMPD